MDIFSTEAISELAQLVSNYGVFALVPILMLEGSIVAIVVGGLAGANVIGFWQSVLVIMISDFIMSHVFYVAGLESTTAFNFLRDKFNIKSNTNSKLIQLRRWATKKLRTNFNTTYTVAKFVPLPYTTITVTILSGMLSISYRKFLKLLIILVPVQGVLFSSIGYFSVQGFFYEVTIWRLLGLALVVFILLIIYAARGQLSYLLSSETED